MMDRIRQYLLTVIAAALICAFVRAIIRQKGATSSIVNLLLAVFMTVSIISPWLRWSLPDIRSYIQDYSSQADTIASEGVFAAQAETSAIIKEQVEAYIEDKATALGITLQADVSVGDSPPYTPETVEISADTSPYLKKKMKEIIATDIGIPEENQIWK